MSCFDYESIPLTIASPITILACNVKLWLNYHTTIHVFVPLRSKVLRFMCNLTDKELRTPAAKTMAGLYIFNKYIFIYIIKQIINLPVRFFVEFKQGWSHY